MISAMRKVIILIALCAVVAAGCSCHTGVTPENKQAKKEKIPQANLKHYHYSRHGMVAQPLDDYELNLVDDGTVTLYVGHAYTAPETSEDTVKVDRDVLSKVAELIELHKMYQYKTSYKPKFEVLDGESWHYEASYDDGTYLHSGGSNAGPDGSGFKAIGQLLDSCYTNAKEKK